MRVGVISDIHGNAAALETVLEWLSPERQEELAVEAMELYLWDRAGSDN